MRLQKYLARAGVASRRKSEELISSGRVAVEGSVVTRLGTRVNPATDRVEVDERRVFLRPAQWAALHKPPGYGCTRKDPQGRPTVYDLLPGRMQHLPHAGRLDFMSEGLLLLSNEGDLVHRILHPRAGVRRVYAVQLAGPVPKNLPSVLLAGVTIEGRRARVESAGWIEAPTSGAPRIEIVLAEGRNREVRRLLAKCGVKINRLCRTAFGPIELGRLAPGRVRDLSRSERSALERVAAPSPTPAPRHRHA